jgi:lysophospholipase L1-like esterase
LRQARLAAYPLQIDPAMDEALARWRLLGLGISRCGASLGIETWEALMRYLLWLVGALAVAASSPGGGAAEPIRIVAFGDSLVFGSGDGRTSTGVPVNQAWPAKLDRALRARGWDLAISNQGIQGGTARDSVYSLDARVPAGTRLTILQFGIADGYLLGASPEQIAQYLAELIRRVRAKGSAVVLVREWSPDDDATFAAVERSADAFVDWYADIFAAGARLLSAGVRLRPGIRFGRSRASERGRNRRRRSTRGAGCGARPNATRLSTGAVKISSNTSNR